MNARVLALTIGGIKKINKIHYPSMNRTTFINTINSFKIVQPRLYCNTENNETVNFNQVRDLTRNNKAFVIDVREPEELIEHGIIPGSINIPLGDIEQTLRDMSEKQFLGKYGRNKPTEDSPVIFSCMKGNRSTKAYALAVQLGFKNVKNYVGGWTDWAEKSKK